MTFSFRSLLVAVVLAVPAVAPAAAVAEEQLSLSVSQTLGRVPVASVAVAESPAPEARTPGGHDAAPADGKRNTAPRAAHSIAFRRAAFTVRYPRCNRGGWTCFSAV